MTTAVKKLENKAGYFFFIPKSAQPNEKAKQTFINPTVIDVINDSVSPMLYERPKLYKEHEGWSDQDVQELLEDPDVIMSNKWDAEPVKGRDLCTMGSDASNMHEMLPNHDVYHIPDFVVEGTTAANFMTEYIADMLTCEARAIESTPGF